MSKKDKKLEIVQIDGIDSLVAESIKLIKYARNLASRQVNLIQLLTYFTLGNWIVEVEQGGKERASYGKKVLENLSQKLNEEFERGFSVRNLRNARQFYLTYKDRIQQTPFAEFYPYT